jgi:hypothetical protein
VAPQIYASPISLASHIPLRPEIVDTLDDEDSFIQFSFDEGWDKDLQIVQERGMSDYRLLEDEVPKITPKQSLSLHGCGELSQLLSSSQMSSFDEAYSELQHSIDLEMPIAFTLLL